MPRKVSIDEIMTARSGSVISTPKGEALTKMVSKQPASWNEERRSARFVMSTEEVDRYGDIIVTEGIDLTLFLTNPVAPLFHRSSSQFPVGTWSNIEKKTRGRPPRLEGDLEFFDEGDYDAADIAARLVSKGKMRAVSIGFMPGDEIDDIRDSDGHFIGYKFVESELLECSLVQIPANPGALVRMAGDDKMLCRDLIEEVLDEYARTSDGLIVPREEYEKRYKEVADEVTIHTLPVLRDIFEPAPEPTVDISNISINLDTTEAVKSIGILKTAVDEFKAAIAGVFGGAGELRKDKMELVIETDVETESVEYVPGSLEEAKALREELRADLTSA